MSQHYFHRWQKRRSPYCMGQRVEVDEIGVWGDHKNRRAIYMRKYFKYFATALEMATKAKKKTKFEWARQQQQRQQPH